MLSVNGGAPIRVELDTGSSYPLVLERSAAQKEHLSLAGREIRDGALQGVSVIPRKVSLIGSDLKPAFDVPIDQVAVLDINLPTQAYEGQPVVGILGAPIFRLPAVRLDFAARELTIYPDPAAAPTGGGAASTTPIDLNAPRDYRPWVSAALGGSLPLRAMLDTGSAATLVPESAAGGLHLAQGDTQDSWTVAGIITRKTALLPNLQIGTTSAHDVPIVLSNPGDPGPSIGMGVLARYRVTVDSVHKCVSLVPGAYMDLWSRLPGQQMVTLEPGRGKTCWIASVRLGSAAEQAGLRAGLQVALIDGLDTSSVSTAVAQSLLNGFAGTRSTVAVVGGNGAETNAEYVRTSAFGE